MMNPNVARYVHYNREKYGISGDTGIVSKAFESIVRDYILDGHTRKGDWKARHMSRMDATFYTHNEQGEKKLIRVEVKCGCGAVCYFTSDGMGGYIDMLEKAEQVTDEMVLPKADFVAFLLESDGRLLDKPEIALNAYVLPREDYVAMLKAMTKTGKLHVKIDKARGQVNMQTLATFNKTTQKWSDKPLQRGYDFLDNCPTAETLESFLRRHGRI